MSLNKLPAATVKLISSAQVITSVSSVVKELIENSLDAGANSIEVKLENHGLKRIEVVDNGKGIRTEDAWNMCKRSFTSKIRSFEDLNTLGTYGFRGEALNSLCAVAKVSVTTKTESDTIAMTYKFDNNGSVVGSSISHVNKGTIVTIENLFDNLPVRKQFLSNGRRKGEEIKKVEMTIKLLAVIHPRLRLSLSHNKFAIWQKTSVPSLRLSLMQAVAPTVVKQLIDLKHTSQQVTLHLLVPEKGCNISSTCYKNPGETVFLFVNQRPVRDRNIEKIIHTELFNFFGHDIPPGKHPTCLASITLPPQSLDVNLEPNKTRVLFKDMDEIGAIIKDKLFEYYVGSLGPPQDFLDSIDAEVAKLAEKRKNTDDDLEIVVKIPKIKENSKGSSMEMNEEKVSNNFIPVSDTNNDYNSVLSCDIKPSVLVGRENSDREKVIAAFLDGLDSSSSPLYSSFKTESPSDDVRGIVGDEKYKEVEVSASSDTVPSSDSVGEPHSPGWETTRRLGVNQITLSQWSRGDVTLDASGIVGDYERNKKEEVSASSDTVPSSDSVGEPHSPGWETTRRLGVNPITLSQWNQGDVTLDASGIVGDYERNKKEEVSASSDTVPSSDSVGEPHSPGWETTRRLGVNPITLSQWSRGDVTLDGTSLQSCTGMLNPKEVLDKSEERTTRIVNSDCRSKAGSSNSEELEGTQAADRSVSSQMGCKDMAGFTKYATEMSKKITEDGKGLSFGRVASELANNWRKLQDSEKEIYNEKAKLKKKPCKESVSKENASMREQLQKFLAKSNEKKILKKRNYPSAIEVHLTISSLRKAIERRVGESGMGRTGWRRVGDLSEDVKCAWSNGGTLYFFSQRRLSESLLYYNNLAAMILPYKVLEKNIQLHQENLGDSLWSVLVSLETAYDVRNGVVLISDNRITSNGLRIEQRKDLSGTYYFQITDVPLQIALFGIDDLKEILTLIDGSPRNLPLEDCRPLKTMSYIRAETIRQISKSDFDPIIGNPFEKFQFWMTTIKPKIELCPHQNSVYKILDVPK